MSKPLSVAYYSDAMTASRRYGLSRYAWELFTELRRDPNLELRPVSAHVRLSVNEVESMKRADGLVPLPWPRKAVALSWWAVGLPLLERWTPWADVVHCVELDYRVATRKPLVVTIHDIGPLTHPQFFGSAHPWLLEAGLRSAARRADAIICVSQATADSVEGYLKCSLGDRMRVIAEGVSAEFLQPAGPGGTEGIGALLATDAPFLLCAGSLNPRKNLIRVIQAFERIADRIPHQLVLVGGIGWDADQLLAQVRSSVVRDRIRLPGRVSDIQLRALYQRASAFVYASLMEGFGLPILEAMASACPVITSSVSSMPEVAGDAAFLVDPGNVDDIAGAMECLATDAVFASHLRHKGLARAQDFRWDACAEAVARVYGEVGRDRPTTASKSPRSWVREAHGPSDSTLAPVAVTDA